METEYPDEPIWMSRANLILEGSNFTNDKSSEWCKMQDDLRGLEKRILLPDFWEETKRRKIDSEFRIIERITKTIKHTQC